MTSAKVSWKSAAAISSAFLKSEAAFWSAISSTPSLTFSLAHPLAHGSVHELAHPLAFLKSEAAFLSAFFVPRKLCIMC